MKHLNLQIITSLIFSILFYPPISSACRRAPDPLKILSSSFEKNSISIRSIKTEASFEILLANTHIYYSHAKKCWLFNDQCINQLDGDLSLYKEKTKNVSAILREDQKGRLSILSVKSDSYTIDTDKAYMLFHRPKIKMRSHQKRLPPPRDLISIQVDAVLGKKVLGTYQTSYKEYYKKEYRSLYPQRQTKFSASKLSTQIPSLNGKRISSMQSCGGKTLIKDFN